MGLTGVGDRDGERRRTRLQRKQAECEQEGGGPAASANVGWGPEWPERPLRRARMKLRVGAAHRTAAERGTLP